MHTLVCTIKDEATVEVLEADAKLWENISPQDCIHIEDSLKFEILDESKKNEKKSKLMSFWTLSNQNITLIFAFRSK